jgi:hypothetical protein
VDTDTLVKLTTIAYNGTVVFLSFSAAFAFLRARRERLIGERHDFLSCTERYLRIQELMVSTESLNNLNLSIYRIETLAGQDATVDSFSKELAVCGMMFQLMEDVWFMHDLDRHKNDPLYSGWMHLFKDWMGAEPVSEKWRLLKTHFSEPFIAFTEREFSPSGGAPLSVWEG